jgi:hypothetical protein
VFFTNSDCQPAAQEKASGTEVANSRSNSRPTNHRLSRGDLVKFTIFNERRSSNKYARSFTFLQSERERAKLEEEKRMLEGATLEHGVVTSLKGEFGFLKSKKRREAVHLQYLSVDLGEEQGGENGELLSGKYKTGSFVLSRFAEFERRRQHGRGVGFEMDY